MAVIWTTSIKKIIFGARDIKSMIFLKCYYISFQNMQFFFVFLVSVINPDHINGLQLFWACFELFYLRISCEAKYFSSLVQGFVIKD